MGEEERHDRNALLAFVERHWRELTLRDAQSLCLEVVELSATIAPIKASLTYR